MEPIGPHQASARARSWYVWGAFLRTNHAWELRMWLRRVSHTLRPKVWARRLPRHAPEDDAPFLEPHISMPLSMTLPPSADSFFLASFLHLT